MRARAYAKVNLGLEVLAARQDGYHELRTIFQTVDFYDCLTFRPADKGIELIASDPGLPPPHDNLVVKAACVLARELGSSEGVQIELEKRIPQGRGLGGGSADAAMTLLALNELWRGGLSEAELSGLATGIGMDVAFFLCGGTALGIGRGDEVYPLECQMDVPIVLILPEFAIATTSAYRDLILTKRESGLKLRSFALSRLGGREELLGLVNDLESATKEYAPAIHGYKESLLELGAAGSMMSGSGSAVYGIFYDEALARSAARTLTARGLRAIQTRTLTRRTYRERRLEAQPAH